MVITFGKKSKTKMRLMPQSPHQGRKTRRMGKGVFSLIHQTHRMMSATFGRKVKRVTCCVASRQGHRVLTPQAIGVRRPGTPMIRHLPILSTIHIIRECQALPRKLMVRLKRGFRPPTRHHVGQLMRLKQNTLAICGIIPPKKNYVVTAKR